jgi:monoterpene epsilon-lactone hydrolase
MSKDQRDTIDQMLRDAPFDLGGDVSVQRPLLEQMLTGHPLADDVRTTAGELGGVAVIFVEIADTDPTGVIFHLHGGGFALGSAASSVGFVSDLARRASMNAVTVDYRLAPEHPFPAALEDVTAAYRALLERQSARTQIVVTGESAGGNLALELLIAGKQHALEMPAAVAVFSPMTDLTATGESFSTKAGVDPNITVAAIRRRAEEYLNGTDPKDPLVSPIYADLTGLPPMLIQAGSHEVLLDDATRLATRAAADDVAVTLDITPDVAHVFQAFAAILDEGDLALSRAATFLQEHVETLITT